MIQTFLDIGILCLRGDKPIFEFDDVKHLEATIFQLQSLAEKLRIQKQDRLEYFRDGIYLDGVRLNLSVLQNEFLKSFEYRDEVSALEISERVWGDSFASYNKIKHVCSRIQEKTGILFYKDGEYYKILRPS